ncbi:MAG: HAD hydrolase family protein [Pseudomonadota bacterium]
MDAKLAERLRQIALIGFDVDGVFTDGRFYLSDDGIESKTFHTQDGYGVRALIRSGVSVAVVSGRRSAAVEHRMRELEVEHVVLGSRDKVQDFAGLTQLLGLEAPQTAFVGDDLPDLPLLEAVGFSFAVANAVDTLKNSTDYVTRRAGGAGAVREICDLLLAARAEDSA